MPFTTENAARHGRKGGIATRDRHGSKHYQEIGKKGYLALVERHFNGCHESYKRYFAELGRWNYWLSTSLPMRYGLDGKPIYRKPKFPTHRIPF